MREVKKLNKTITDFTMSRNMMVKDTFMSVFPNYGVQPDEKESLNRTFYAWSPWNPIEQKETAKVDKSHFNRLDEFKIYTEELLKAKNMMG